jgi:hypothetical protein
MSEKQTTFFTINCAENLESPNQCMVMFKQQRCNGMGNKLGRTFQKS